MIKKLLAGAVILGAFSMSAHAADSKGSFIVRGAGLTKCSTLINDLQGNGGDGADARVGYAMGYISGYFTAVNAYAYSGKDVLQGADEKSVYKAVLGWCAKNPSNTLDDATETLLQAVTSK